MADKYRIHHMFVDSTGKMMTNSRVDELEKLPEKELNHHIDRGNVVVLDQPRPRTSSIKKMGKDDLKAEAERLNLDVKGTGSKGNVTKKDLVKALENAEPDTEE